VRREVNTMPNWAGSCWYYLRYCDPCEDTAIVDRDAEAYWMGSTGVDLYVGGAEHAVLHLLYARFWHKVLFDLGCVSQPEPMKKLFHQGLITSFSYQRPDGSLVPSDQVEERGDSQFVESATGQAVKQVVAKMSKSLKNVVNPDDVIAEYGADTMRLYEMYMGPLEASKPWNPRDITGLFRFIQRAWRLLVDEETGRARTGEQGDEKVEKALHRTVAKVGADIERLAFNTAIAAMIEFVNLATASGAPLTRSQAERFALTLAPFAPHLAEEVWSRLGHTRSLAYEPWPQVDERMLRDTEIELPVQVNGKLRDRITVPAEAEPKAVESAALSASKVREALEGKTVVKIVVVPRKLVNIVIK
jgi:leucyl-tRNA synthetase